MSIRGQLFADHWVADNIRTVPHGPAVDPALVQEMADTLLAAAQAEGITRQEIEEEVGDVGDLIIETMENAADDRLAGPGA